MVDEYLQRYLAVEQAQLYRELTSGSPPQVDALADLWYTTAQTMQATAADLRADLATLQTSWSGQTSNQFQYRLGLVATFAETIAAEAMNMYTGLAEMSAALTIAQGHGMPVPTRAADWEHDEVLGPLLGHTVTEADLIQSHEALATTVAQLAISYLMADHTDWSTPRPDPSPDLPGRALAIDLGVDTAPADPTQTPGPTAPPGAGTKLAGTVGDPPPAPVRPTLPLARQVSPPAGPPVAPPSPVTAVTMLQGAGTSLAASADVGPAAGRDTEGTVTGSSASLPPPVMGAGGFAPRSGWEPGLVSRPLHDETAWAAGEDDAWAHPDESPPPVLGPTRPA